MGRPKRSEQFSPTEICIVHSVQRCVRRAYLAGIDEQSGKDYSFRREWIRRRLEALASVFGIDVLTYAVMSNHLHLILRNRPDVVAAWSDAEVAVRWLRVFPGRRLEEQLAEPSESDVEALAQDRKRLAVIRLRLADISWFMRALAEPIARMANRQDECTGRFWEGRFKAQRIVDDAGLLACAMYVDLNPVRAALAASPEKSRHTSAYDRIQSERGATIPSAALDRVVLSQAEAGKKLRQTPVAALRAERKARRRGGAAPRRVPQDAWLAPLSLSPQASGQDPQLHTGGLRASDKGFLGLSWHDYLRLLQWTAGPGGSELSDAIPKKLSPVLSRLGLEASMWRDLVWNFRRYFRQSSCAGSPPAMEEDAKRLGKRWHRGQRSARVCFKAAG